MKKIFWSLAALMLMAAPVMTSCSNDLEEVAPAEEVKDNVVTLTIKMPVQAETRVGIDDGTLKLTGWEENDVVKVYHFEYPEGLSEGVTFTCTAAAEGTFTGTLPAGKTLDNYNFAVYGRDVMYNPSKSEYVLFPANEVHDNLKDCICLAGPLDNGSCTMTIYNNVIKVTNYDAPVTGVWKQRFYENMKLYGQFLDKSSFAPSHRYESSTFEEAKITIPSGVSYIFMPQLKGENMGFYDEDGTEIIPKKTFATVVGKLYNVTLGTPPPVYSIAAMRFYEAEAAVPSNFVSMSKEDAVAMAKEKQANEGCPGYILIYEHVSGDTYKYITSDHYKWEGTAEIKNIRSEHYPFLELQDCENCGYFECYWFTVVE